jgi:hypothetical protein
MTTRRLREGEGEEADEQLEDGEEEEDDDVEDDAALAVMHEEDGGEGSDDDGSHRTEQRLSELACRQRDSSTRGETLTDNGTAAVCCLCQWQRADGRPVLEQPGQQRGVGQEA